MKPKTRRPGGKREGTMRINRRLKVRMALLITSIIVLTLASTRHRADTGTCGGQSITLPFTDVMGSQFFCQIAEAFFSGLANGTSATTYNPSGTVTRDQMAAFITRTQDSALRRGSRRAALGQWAIPSSLPLTGRTLLDVAPQAVATDGADIWVASQSIGTISRIRGSDGRLLETWTGASRPTAILVARGRIYITGAGDPGNIYVIDPSQQAGSVTLLSNT